MHSGKVTHSQANKCLTGMNHFAILIGMNVLAMLAAVWYQPWILIPLTLVHVIVTIQYVDAHDTIKLYIIEKETHNG